MKIILLAILIAIGSCSCFDRLKDSRNTLYVMSQQYSQDQNLDNYIDHFFDWAKTAPTTMEECGAQDLGAYFHNNFPDKCIDTLDVAVKKMIKLNGEKDNEIKYAIDLALLQRYYKTRVQKECPTFKELTIDEIYGKGECAESSYQLSLYVQKFFIDAANYQGQKAIEDLDDFLTKLPNTLDTCGYSDLANKLRLGIPPECIKSIDTLARNLLSLERTYDHLALLMKNLRLILKAYKQVRFTCPIFGEN